MENLVFFFVFSLIFAGAKSTNFTFTNKCYYKVWVGTLNNPGKPALAQTGFQLDSGATVVVGAPAGWGGRMWGRTQCTSDASGKFSCITGDCYNQIPCNQGRNYVLFQCSNFPNPQEIHSSATVCNCNGPWPPATLAEFTLNGDGNKDFYDISLVDGFNLPFSITPQGGTGECAVSSCSADVNAICPEELRVLGPNGATVACKSACEAFNSNEYCCRGVFNTPETCKPSSYSLIFENACPAAYSYAYDDMNSTFTCTGADYILTFCPQS